MIKLLISLCIGFVWLISFVQPVFAYDATIHLFWSQGCPHCAKEKVFLESLQKKYPSLTIKEYELTHDQHNRELLEQLEDTWGGTDIPGVPFTLIGDKKIIGYLSDETTGKEIEDAVQQATAEKSTDIVSTLSSRSDATPASASEDLFQTITLPLFGQIALKNLSLPVLTLVLAFLDGFNPCAMWTLLFLISLLLGMQDRKRMWILGIAFIISSATVYFLFLSAWLNVFLFLGFVVWVRAIVALVALGAGVYNIRDYYINTKGGCHVMGDQKRQKFFENIRTVTQKQNFFLALLGIIALAIAVNMIELVCSAGLPAIYTKILSLSQLETWQYYMYLIAYTIIFMLDDLFVFFTAMITLRAVGIESKYARYSHLIGGCLMVIIGLLLLFKPELLMFG